MKHRIAFIRDSLDKIDGTRRVFIDLANNLFSIYDVYIVNGYKNTPVYDISPQVKEVYYLHEVKKRLRYSLLGDILALRNYFRKNQIDVAVASGRSYPVIVALACIGIKTKAIMSEHNCVYGLDLELKRRKNWLDKGLLEWSLNRLFDRTVLLTEGEVSIYKMRYPKASHVGYIYNHISEKLISSVSSYDADSRKIITVGRIDYQKGYEYLVAVAKRVLEKHPDWHWDIYGGGDANYTAEIVGRIQAAGLEDKLVLKGNRHDIYDRYKDYGIYVMTSRYEGLPMVLLEAKAKKLPIVSFDIHSGPSDIILDGVNGYLVKPFDVDAMAERICFLIEHPEVRADFSAHAYDNIDKFRKEAVMKQWVDLINGVLKSGGVTLSSKGYGCAWELGGAAC